MEDCKPAITQIESKSALKRPENPDEEEMKRYPYQSLIGSLMFLAVSTRPDIAFAVNFLSQFNSNYSAEHWKASKRILRYLKGTKMLGLLFKKTGDDLYGLVDADWGSNLSDRRSYSGQAFILAGASISWEARKQRTVALSSTESEYLAMSEAVKEALYLKALLNRIGSTCDSVRIFNDNQSAQQLVKGFGFHPRTKHIDVRHHFIQEKEKSGDITVAYMPTEKMPADVLTKGLCSSKHNNCILSLGITNI
nr:secreted RxLR effector protein 161-like [Drosophila kikkawai]